MLEHLAPSDYRQRSGKDGRWPIHLPRFDIQRRKDLSPQNRQVAGPTMVWRGA
ncbi:hypothetical protein [Paracoccus mutanolyticus]|nr:hypothetical protein [Paracoccus mutanolyticus]